MKILMKKLGKILFDCLAPGEAFSAVVDIVAIRRPASRHGLGVPAMEGLDEALGGFEDGRFLGVGIGGPGMAGREAEEGDRK